MAVTSTVDDDLQELFGCDMRAYERFECVRNFEALSHHTWQPRHVDWCVRQGESSHSLGTLLDAELSPDGSLVLMPLRSPRRRRRICKGKVKLHFDGESNSATSPSPRVLGSMKVRLCLVSAFTFWEAISVLTIQWSCVY